MSTPNPGSKEHFMEHVPSSVTTFVGIFLSLTIGLKIMGFDTGPILNAYSNSLEKRIESNIQTDAENQKQISQLQNQVQKLQNQNIIMTEAIIELQKLAHPPGQKSMYHKVDEYAQN